MVVYECEYTVDSRDIDPWYHCRPSGLMGMLQEAATQAACALHVSRDEMLERYNSFWMLAPGTGAGGEPPPTGTSTCL